MSLTARIMGALAGGALAALQVHAASGLAAYQVVRQIAATTARWDYAAVDSAAQRLYVGRVGGVLAVDLQSGISSILAPSALVHGVLPIPDSDRVMSTNGKDNTVTVFNGTTGRVISTIATGREPDAIIFDPRTGLVITTNEESQSLTLIDPIALKAVGEIVLPGKPEYPAADGRGSIYDNIESRNEIAQVDVANRHVVRTLPLPGCDRPTGLAYDREDELLISVCHNGVAVFLDSNSGHVQATIKIGKVPDAVLFDAARRLVLIPCGDPGILSVVAVRSGVDIHLVQTLKTRPGSRTGALDPKTGTVYLPSAQFVAPLRVGAHPQIVPDSFSIMVVAPAAAGDAATAPGEARVARP